MSRAVRVPALPGFQQGAGLVVPCGGLAMFADPFRKFSRREQTAVADGIDIERRPVMSDAADDHPLTGRFGEYVHPYLLPM